MIANIRTAAIVTLAVWPFAGLLVWCAVHACRLGLLTPDEREQLATRTTALAEEAHREREQRNAKLARLRAFRP